MKKLVTLVMVGILLLSTGCNNKKEVEELQEKIETLESENQQLIDDKQEMANTIVELETEIDDLKNDNSDIKEKLEALEQTLKDIPKTITGEDTEFEIGDTLVFSKCIVKVTDISIVKTEKGDPCLKMVYDVTNTDTKDAIPMFMFFKDSYQDERKVESDAILLSDDVDFNTETVPIKLDETLTDVEVALPIKDMNKPLTIKLTGLLDFGGNFAYTIDDLNNLK
ncbi:MAG: DUF5067 domain-containing protein [Clostridiaceae bacterium]|nr:DUF5067 domain-containing protein [Clostridiaceae bacterium]